LCAGRSVAGGSAKQRVAARVVAGQPDQRPRDLDHDDHTATAATTTAAASQPKLPAVAAAAFPAPAQQHSEPAAQRRRPIPAANELDHGGQRARLQPRPNGHLLLQDLPVPVHLVLRRLVLKFLSLDVFYMSWVLWLFVAFFWFRGFSKGTFFVVMICRQEQLSLRLHRLSSSLVHCGLVTFL